MAVTVNVRMYKVGELGDCFLLTFTEGDALSHVLIDCGSFRNKKESRERMVEIAKHIREDLQGKKLDIVVGTHQHNDHLSGFVHAEENFKGLVNKVWLSWLDDPSDSFARRVYNEQKELVNQVKEIYAKAHALKLDREMVAVNDVLGFYAADGGDPEIPSKGVEILKKIGSQKVQYLRPGDTPSLPGFTKSQVKVYTLGPPRNKALLFDKDPKKGESYDHSLALASASAGKLLSALNHHSKSGDTREEDKFPFIREYKLTEDKYDDELRRLYKHPDNKWRRIDNDWLDEADELALYLDTYTNNSSLVLAFELVDSGKVLLFAADAQTGNWLSWDKIQWKGNMTTQKLLENTVLYKVGHHGSHNATLVAGLEAMIHPELVAMIPVDRSDANIKKPNGWKMPAKNLYKRLKEKTQHRILVMDKFYGDDCHPINDKPLPQWDQLPFKPKENKKNGYVEYTVKG